MIKIKKHQIECEENTFVVLLVLFLFMYLWADLDHAIECSLLAQTYKFELKLKDEGRREVGTRHGHVI